MPFKRKCKTFKKIEGDSMSSTTNFLISQELIDNFGSIKDLPQFRQAAQWLKEEANKKGYFPDLLVYDTNNGTKVGYNIPAFKKLDGINTQIEKVAQRQPELFTNEYYQLNNTLSNLLQSSIEKSQNPELISVFLTPNSYLDKLTKYGFSQEEIDYLVQPLKDNQSLWIDAPNIHNLIAFKVSEQLKFENTKSSKTANEELDKILKDYLSELNITVNEFRDLKSQLGVDALGVAHIINKSIDLSENRRIDTLPEEAGHFYVELLTKRGTQDSLTEYNLYKDLMSKIENWEKYKEIEKAYLPIYKDKNKVKKEAIAKAISEAIVNRFESKNDSLKQAIIDFLDWIKSIFKNRKNFNIDLLADDIAKKMLSGDYSDIAKDLDQSTKLTNYKDIDKDTLDLIDVFSKFGATMTGSMSLRKQGTIYRTEKETFHDIDFKVPLEIKDTFLQKVKAKFPDIHQRLDFETEYSYNTIWSLDYNGKEYSIDFFFEKRPFENVGNLVSWRDTFAAKVQMGRQKDVTDFINYKIFENNTELSIGQDTYYQLDQSKENVDRITEELKNAPQDNIVKTVDDFFNVTRSRLTKLIKNKNYAKLKELFTTAEGINRFDNLSDLLKAANKAVEDVEGIARKTRALAIGIIQTETFVDEIANDVKDIISNRDSALENITTLQYYLYTLNDWSEFLEDTREIFEGNPNTIRTIDSILGKIKAIDNNIIHNDVAGLTEVFKPLLTPAYDKFKQPLVESINYNKKLLKSAKSPEDRKKYENIIKAEEKKLKEFDFSLDENIADYLKGKRGDINYYSSLLESYADNPDPIVSSFTIWLKNNMQDINAETSKIQQNYEADIAKPYEELSRFNPEEVGKQITFEDERVDYDGNPVNIVTLLNPWKGYKKDDQTFFNEINALKELIKNQEEVELNTEKLIAKKKEYSQWKLDYMNQEFVPEFYKKYELWEDETGQALKLKVDNIFDQIKQIQTPSLLGVRELSDTELDEIDALLKEYKLLGNVNELDGTTKTGNALKEAQRMQAIRALNNQFFEWKDNLPAFEKAKLRHSEFIISQGLVENSPEYLKEMEIWEDNNTRTVITPEFYERREELFQEINDLLSIFRSEESTEDFQEVWEDIKGIVYGHRDEDNQPIGTEIARKGAQRIKDATLRLEEIKNAVSNASGLSKNEQSRLSELIEKINDKSINTVERDELKQLFDKQKANGLSEASKKRLFTLFEELKELQSRVPTEYYVDAFNNISQKYSVTIDNSGLVQGEAISILDSPKLQELLQNEDFKDWFELNHIQVEVFNKETKQPELKWQRTYQWNRIIPNDAQYMDVKPSLKYSYRVVKDEYKTKQEVGVTTDNKGNYLPKTNSKDDRYVNKEYFRLKNSTNPQEKALYSLLKTHTDYLLKAQEDIPNPNKLYLDVPRLRKSDTERNIKMIKELYSKPSDIPSVMWKGITSKWDSLFDANEDTGNFQSVFADKYGNEFTKIPMKYIQPLDSEDVSLDLFRAIMKYTYSAKMNKKLIEISPVSTALQRVLGNEKFTPRDITKTIKGRVTEFVFGKTNERELVVNKIIARVFQGRVKNGLLPVPVEKAIGVIKGLTVIKTIAFDVPASVANVVNAETQNFISASNGYISRTNLGAAHNIFFTQYFPAFQKDYWENKIGNKSLQSQIFDLYGFVQSHTFDETLGEKVSQSKVKDALALNWLRNHREWGELFVQSVNALAYLDATKVQQGQETISLNNAYELDSKGNLQLKPNVDESWAPDGAKFKELKERISLHNSRVHGNYAKGIDKPEIETYTLYSAFFMMKRFFMSMFLNRFAASNVRVNKTGIRSSARFNTRIGQEHGYYLKTLELISKEIESKSVTGEFQALTDDEKIALFKTLADVGVVITAWLLLKLAFDFDPDDKDKYKKLRDNDWFTNQLIYQTARLQTEASTFFNLSQYQDFILGSPIIGNTLKAWSELIGYTISQETYEKDSGLYEKGESKAKARLYKVTGMEKVLKTGDQDQMVEDYLKMRAR